MNNGLRNLSIKAHEALRPALATDQILINCILKPQNVGAPAFIIYWRRLISEANDENFYERLLKSFIFYMGALKSIKDCDTDYNGTPNFGFLLEFSTFL